MARHKAPLQQDHGIPSDQADLGSFASLDAGLRTDEEKRNAVEFIMTHQSKGRNDYDGILFQKL
ncbi:hypothetical protein N7501_004754 [Penicillium viridicatum]|nr:hypothetical protein N7501_004754 [Penicillium viridicatum]